MDEPVVMDAAQFDALMSSLDVADNAPRLTAAARTPADDHPEDDWAAS